MESVTRPSERSARSVPHLPIERFGVVMGLATLAHAWQLAAARDAVPPLIGTLLAGAALLVLALLLLGYAGQLYAARGAVAAEWADPVRKPLVGTLWIALLLAPILLAPYALMAARVLWGIGALGALLWGWHVPASWLRGGHRLAHVTPAWLIPIVGVLDLPLALPALHLHALTPALTAFALAYGALFTPLTATLVVLRLTLGPPLAPAQIGALAVLVAPVAVASADWHLAFAPLPLPALGLLLLACMLLAMVLPHVAYAIRPHAFHGGWWTLGFPLAATAVAALLLPPWSGPLGSLLAALLLAIASAVIAALAMASLHRLWRRIVIRHPHRQGASP